MPDTKNKDLPRHLDPAEADFDLFISPYYLIAHADFKYHGDLDKAIVKFGLDRTTYRLLTVLMRRSPINIRDLSTLALLNRSTAGRALDRMRRKDWVINSLNKEDNRITDVYLTSAGREIAQRAMQLGSRQLKRAVEGLDEGQLKELITMLQHLVRNLSKLPME